MSLAITLLLLALIFLRLVIGGQLVLSARRNRLPNLYWLSAVFFINFLGLPFAPSEGNPLAAWEGARWVFNAYTIASGVVFIVFLHQTFYTKRRSPVGWILAQHFVLGAVGIYGLFVSPPTTLSFWVGAFSLSGSVLWIWHVVAAYEAYQAIATDPAVEDWVKARYQMMLAFAMLYVISTVSNLVRIVVAGGGVEGPLASFTGALSLITSNSVVILQFLVWVMPEPFRRWLNRNQKQREEAQAHERTWAVLQVLGSAMCAGTGLREIGALYALRALLGKTFNSDDPKQVETQAARLGYQEWLRLLDNPELQRLCANVGANVDARRAVHNAKQALNDKQALFTMQAQ